MPNLCSDKQCVSCLACYNACQFGAISIAENALSVKIPVVNTERCKNCGLCEKSCPIINSPVFNEPQKALAVYSKNDSDKRICASGGAATVFSRDILNSGGIVYGATSYGGYPKFIQISKANELKLLVGSKYVYCDPCKIYAQVGKDLKAGRKCLFIGVPCNVAGLLSYLGKQYDNLLTIDLICHGTPPFAYLSKHLIAKNIDVTTLGNITFRGELDFQLAAYDRNNQIIYKCNQYEDEYFAAFMRGVMFRPVCYSCQYAKRERVSDITIGDFWGISKDALDNYDGKISVALLNTEKGRALFDASSDKFVWEERSIDEAVYNNPQLNRPSCSWVAATLFHAAYMETSSITTAFRKSGIKRIVRKNKFRWMILYIPKLIRNLFLR